MPIDFPESQLICAHKEAAMMTDDPPETVPLRRSSGGGQVGQNDAFTA